MQIDIDMDFVSIEGEVIKRPDRIPRGWWLQFWDAVKWQHCVCPNCGKTYELGRIFD